MATDGVLSPIDDEFGWVLDAQAGDRQAFARLIDRYWDRLYRWLYHLSHDPHMAEDLAQETFLKAFAKIAQFRAGSNFRAWLFRIAHNLFVTQLRAPVSDQPLPLQLADGEAGPFEQALGRETLLRLTRAVGRLPTEFRSAFLLRAEEGLSFRQIAAVLGINEQTARWRVFKARQKLMKVLDPLPLDPRSERS